MKVCAACKANKSLEDFHKNKNENAPGGVKSQCKACVKVKRAEYYALNREHELEHNRLNAKVKKRWLTEERKQYMRKWKHENPDSVNAQTHKRRAQIVGNGGTYSIEEWRELCNRFGGHCARCHIKTKLTVDHVVPISLGGSNSIENIQPLCGPCNNGKRDTVAEYRPWSTNEIINFRGYPREHRRSSPNNTVRQAV